MAVVISLIFLSVGFGVLVLIHACIVGMTIRRGLSEHNVNTVERGNLGSTSMSREDIEKLPCFDFKGKGIKGGNPPPDCAVCLENFRVGERCRLLPSCNHSFHSECVDLWLLRTPICPICRAGADIIKKDNLPESRAGGTLDSGETVTEVRNSQETGNGDSTETANEGMN